MARTPRRLNAFTATKIGDWKGVEKFFGSLGIEMKKKISQAQWDICKKLRDTVIDHITAQDLNWEDLSERTVKLKKKNKDLILIDTETYVSNIKMWRANGVVNVGVKKGTTYKRKSGSVSLERVAIWLEYGTSKMPARPLWNPSFEELGGKEGMRDYVVDAIFRRLKWLAKGKPITITKKSVAKQVKF